MASESHDSQRENQKAFYKASDMRTSERGPVIRLTLSFNAPLPLPPALAATIPQVPLRAFANCENESGRKESLGKGNLHFRPYYRCEPAWLGIALHAFDDLPTQAGLPSPGTLQARVRAHLRQFAPHTAVSLLKDAGVPDAVVMALVGHESAAMSRHYTHVGKEALARAAKTLPEV